MDAAVRPYGWIRGFTGANGPRGATYTTVWSVSHAVDGGGFGGRFGGDAWLCARAAPPGAPVRHRCRLGRARLAVDFRDERRHRVRRARSAGDRTGERFGQRRPVRWLARRPRQHV